MSFVGKLRAAREKHASAQDESKRLANGWATDMTTREKVDASLTAQGIDAGSIMTESFVDAIGKLEAIVGRASPQHAAARNRTPSHYCGARPASGL